MTRRTAAVAGQFYPASKEELGRYFEAFNEMLSRLLKNPDALQTASRAVIVPHAGYVYSGFTANAAYRLLANADLNRVAVIGPSHRVGFEGSSVGAYEAYETPLGDLTGGGELAAKLKERFGFGFLPEAHAEHSTETQFPFLKHYMPDVGVVELVYGHESPDRLAEAIRWLLEDNKTGVIISTDLSHFHDLAKARTLDGICLEAVATTRPEVLYKGCEACGRIGMEAMLKAAVTRGMEPMVLDYRTSADASGDTGRVVGYMSAAFLE